MQEWHLWCHADAKHLFLVAKVDALHQFTVYCELEKRIAAVFVLGKTQLSGSKFVPN